MSIGNAYPEHPQNSTAPPLPDMHPALFQLQTTMTDVAGDSYGMNLAAAVMQDTTPATLDTIQRQHQNTERQLAHYGGIMVRLIQANTAYDDVFFDAVSRTDAQLRAFMASDSQQPTMPDCPPAAAWHEQIKDYRPVSQLALPDFLQNFGVEIAPRIRTTLSADAGGTQVGYLQTSGPYIGHTRDQQIPIDMKAIGRLRVPLLATVESSAKLSPPLNPEEVTGHDYARRIGEYSLTQTHKLFSSRPLKQATAIDAVAVTPGIWGIGSVVSTDMCVNLGWQDFAEGDSPGAYRVTLLKNGIRQNERVIDPVSDSRLLGASTLNPFLSVPPQYPGELRDWRDNDPFTREDSDMHLSVLGIPVTVLTSRADPRYVSRQPAVKHQQDGITTYLQRDRERSPFMANVAVVASY